MKIIDEATDKSTDERVKRSIRQNLNTRRTARNPKKRDIDPLGRIVPKKTASSNDPTRGGNRLQIREAVKFIRENLDKAGPELEKQVRSFPFKDTLRAMVDHMIATRLGGWREESGKYVNESGREASVSNWSLKKDRLVPLKGKEPSSYDIDWLLEARENCG